MEGPVYIRLGMNREKEFFSEDYRFPAGVCEVLREGSDVALFSTGSILDSAMEAAFLLDQLGISVAVINVPKIKPFDNLELIQHAGAAKLVCVVEEHNIIGGLASEIADAIVDAGIAKKLLRIGLNDHFSVGYGPLSQLRKENGLDAETVVEKIRNALCVCGA